jgi:hypothetical protein
MKKFIFLIQNTNNNYIMKFSISKILLVNFQFQRAHMSRDKLEGYGITIDNKQKQPSKNITLSQHNHFLFYQL